MRNLFISVLLLAIAACTTTGSPEKSKMAEGYYDRGISFLSSKDYEKALVEFQKSINTNPDNKMSRYAMGIVYDMMGKYSDAEKYYKEAIDIDSEFSDAHNALGTIYMKQKKWKEAEKSFQRALKNKLYTTPNITYVNLGDLYMTTDDYPKAIESYREAKRYVNQDYIIYRLGMAYLKAGKVREAVTELQEGVSLTPKNPDMRLSLALALLKDGNKRAALTEFQKVVEFAPGTEQARTAKDYITTLDPASSKKPKSR